MKISDSLISSWIRAHMRDIRETPERLEALTRRFAEEFVDSPEGIPKDVRTPRIEYFVQRLISDMQEIVRRMHDEFKVSK